MNYRVKLASFAIAAQDIGPIPGTEQVLELDTDKGTGREIWWGYLQMREVQKGDVQRPGNPYEVKQPSTASEKEKFREAIDLFFRFMAGGGRDNFQQVTTIEELTPEVAPEEPDAISV